MKKLQNDQQGLAHIALIAVIVAVIAVVGFAAWRVMGKQKENSITGVANTVLDKAAIAECEKKNDKDLCKFYSSWKASSKYSMTSTEADGSKSVFEVDGNKSHIAMTGETSYEVITIDKTTYTKAGDKWYKQTITKPEQDVSSDYKADLKDPEDEAATAEDKTVYKSLGKEACGNLTCFKYEITDPEAADEKQFIWFDDKDYQLQKSRSETKEGASEQVYAYANVSIKEPSPVIELGPNQYIVPGQSEPMTMPSAADLGA